MKDEAYGKLKDLFYAIQQTSYYCDFTLESAEFVYEKYGEEENMKMIQDERKKQKEMWDYILKEQIAPVRWSMLMWTRFNIAEPAIKKTAERFDSEWEQLLDELDKINAPELAVKLGWDWEVKLSHEQEKKDGWSKAFEDWVAPCYPAPAGNKILSTDSTTCHHGLATRTVLDAVKDSTDMWFEFAVPLLEAYEKSDGADKDLHDAVFHKLKNLIYNTGKAHSFRCEWIWILTRVRIFEIIPAWEITRVADDTNANWNSIVEFRNAMLDYGVEKKGLYSDATFDEMEAKKDRIHDFLQNWAEGDDSVFDKDQEGHRSTLKGLTKELSEEAIAVYNWYFDMAYQEMEWKDGERYDANVSTNYAWGSRNPPSKARFARDHAVSKSRNGWRLEVWRELVKFNFHFWRRI